MANKKTARLNFLLRNMDLVRKVHLVYRECPYRAELVLQAKEQGLYLDSYPNHKAGEALLNTIPQAYRALGESPPRWNPETGKMEQ